MAALPSDSSRGPRPLVVVSGQGLSLADGFDLTLEVRELIPHALVGAEDPQNLDVVILRAREHTPTEQFLRGRGIAHDILRTVDRLCRIGRLRRRRLHTTQRLCELLAACARSRLVVFFTTNVDSAARLHSVETGRAEWPLGSSPRNAVRELETIRLWLEEIPRREAGFFYVPLHGEADLITGGDGGLTYATRDRSADLLARRREANFTLGEGLGQNVTFIEQRLWLSQLAYQLLRTLLLGGRSSRRTAAGQAAPAHLLVIGYGAGKLLGGVPYPLEGSLALAARLTQRDGLSRGARIALVGPDRKGEAWFGNSGFDAVVAALGTDPCSAFSTRSWIERLLGTSSLTALDRVSGDPDAT